MTFKLGQIEGGVGRVLSFRRCILVYVDRSLWKIVLAEECVEIRNDLVELTACVSNLMPRVNIGDRIVCRYGGQPRSPGRTLKVRYSCTRWPADERIRKFGSGMDVSFGLRYQSGQYWPDDSVSSNIVL